MSRKSSISAEKCLELYQQGLSIAKVAKALGSDRDTVHRALKSVGYQPRSTIKDRTGQKYGQLTFVKRTKKKSGSSIIWELHCDCGRKCYSTAKTIVDGDKTTCKKCCGPKLDRTGKIYGMVKVIRPTYKRDKASKTVIWEVLCDCGKITNLSGSYLQSSTMPNCGCRPNSGPPIKDRVGQKFGMLTFIRQTDQRDNSHVVWELLCDCGNIVIKAGTDIVGGKIRSCGCIVKNGKHTRIYDPVISTARQVWKSSYDDGLTFEEFYALSQQPCYYCKREPFRKYNVGWHRVASKDQLDNGDFTYNGIDRIDSSKTHTMDNVVPCCFECNRMKLDMDLIEWLEHIELIYNGTVDLRRSLKSSSM